MLYDWNYTLCTSWVLWSFTLGTSFSDSRNHFFQYGTAHVLGPHRRFDKDLWSSFSASGQKHSLWQHVMKNGNHLDKQHGSWGLWNLVLINHGGNKLILITAAKRFIQTYAIFQEVRKRFASRFWATYTGIQQVITRWRTIRQAPECFTFSPSEWMAWHGWNPGLMGASQSFFHRGSLP